MDGLAVKAEMTFGASAAAPRELVVDRDAFYVNTGHVLPPGTNAVVMIEQVNDLGDGRVAIDAPAFPWQHVRRMGEDIVATELLFPRYYGISVGRPWLSVLVLVFFPVAMLVLTVIAQ